MKREILQFLEEEAADIVFGDHDDFEAVENKITSTSRWSEYRSVVVKRISDGKFFSSNYSQGLTEMQDQAAYEYDDPIFKEVVPIEETIITYGWPTK